MNIMIILHEGKEAGKFACSIGARVEDDDLVSVFLNSLSKEYRQFQTSIGVRLYLIFGS